MFGYKHFVNKLTQLSTYWLTIFQFDIHVNTLLLKQLYFTAYRAKILLKTVKHWLNWFKCFITRFNLTMKFYYILSLMIILIYNWIKFTANIENKILIIFYVVIINSPHSLFFVFFLPLPFCGIPPPPCYVE